MSDGPLDTWGFRYLAPRLLYYVEKLKLSYDLAFQRAFKDVRDRLPGVSRKTAYYAGRDLISRYYTLEYMAEVVYGKFWYRRRTRTLTDLWIYYFGKGYIDERDHKRFSKKICREAPKGKLPDLEELLEEPEGIGRISVELSYPRWVVAELADIMGIGETRALLKALNEETIWLRVNTFRTDVDEAVKALEAEGARVKRHRKLEYMLRLSSSRKPVSRLKPVLAGYVIPQDLGSAMVTEELEDGGLLLDACSAPGGKMALFVARRRGTAIGCDLSAKRLRSEAILLREAGVLGPRVNLIRCDASHYTLARKTDQVLLDAPCSGSGSIRRDPAVKIALRRKRRIEYYTELQRELLMNALRNSRNLVVYATCSILPEEGEDIVRDMHILESRMGLSRGYRGIGYRIHPHIHDAEGFFVARLAR